MPGKDARRTALIQVKIVALAPMPKANVVTTTKVKPGFLNSVRRLYRKSCQKVSMIRLFLLSTSIDSASDLANGCWASRPRESARWLAQPRLRRRFLGVQTPCSILQSYDAESLVYRHSSRKAMPTPMRTNGQTKWLLT